MKIQITDRFCLLFNVFKDGSNHIIHARLMRFTPREPYIQQVWLVGLRNICTFDIDAQPGAEYTAIGPLIYAASDFRVI